VSNQQEQIGEAARTLFMPVQASTFAEKVDATYYGIYWLSVVMFVGVISAAAWFVLKYKRKHHQEIPSGPLHATFLEVFWSVLPLIAVMIIFFSGFKGYMYLAIPPDNATEIYVSARKWSWQFTYPNGLSEMNELRVPKGAPIKLIMTSISDEKILSLSEEQKLKPEDVFKEKERRTPVLHSFYVPAFRVKKDVVPGQYSTLWFEATQVGSFDVFCAEYCGTNHSDMRAKIIVMEPQDYKQWLEKAAAGNIVPTADLGKELYRKQNCFTCHSVDGSPSVGPTFKGLFGKNESFADGSSKVVDENYLRESVVDPKAKIVKGFPPIMPPYKGLLKDPEITSLIEYIKTLK